MKKTNPFSIPGDSPELLEQLVFLRRLPGKMKVKPYQQKTGEPEDMPASQGADPLTPLSGPEQTVFSLLSWPLYLHTLFDVP